MRVVAGIAKGRRLVAPRGDSTRPTSDFVREAIFNTLGSHLDLEGISVADLFAGTGALGIEALSRGARSADFVDADRAAAAAIRQNLAATGLEGGTVHQSDVLRWLRRRVPDLPAFDIVFADPPYAFAGWHDLIESLPAGLAVLESDREIDPGPGWRVLRMKRYGSTVVTLTSPRPDLPPQPKTWSRM